MMHTFILYYERNNERHRAQLNTSGEVTDTINRLIDSGVDYKTIEIYNDVGTNCTKYFINEVLTE